MIENKNNCQKAIDQLIDELDAKTSKDETQILEELVRMYPTCEVALRSKYTVWSDLSTIEVPEPSQSMHANFYEALGTTEGSTTNKTEKANSSSSTKKWILLASIGALLMASYFIVKKSDEQKSMINQLAIENALLKNEIDELYFAIKDGATANHRIEKIENVLDFEKPDDRIFQALNMVLLNDKKVSVRLSAIETLLHFVDENKVREYLIKSIPHQKSPIVQLTLADAMVSIQEKRSLQQFRILIDNGSLEKDVKEYLELTVKELM